MLVIKREKKIVSGEIAPSGRLIKKTKKGEAIIDKNNYYLSKEVIIADKFYGGYDWEILDSQIVINEQVMTITDYMNDYYERFEGLAEAWEDNFLNIPSFKRRKVLFEQALEEIDWNDEGIPDKLKLNKEWCDMIHDKEVPVMTTSDELWDEPDAEYSDMSDWWSGLKGQRRYAKTLLHHPMIICDKSDSEALDKPSLPFGTIQAKIVAASSLSQNSKGYIELSDMERPEITSTKVDKGDLGKAKFTEADRQKLASRGVQAKQFFAKKGREQIKKDKSLNKDFDTSELEKYLSTPFREINRVDANKEYLLDRGNNADFTLRWFDTLSRLEEFQALEFSDRVMAEVIANSSRNVEKDVFIMRKIFGYEAYVLIKPTSLGSVNDPKPTFYSIIFKGRSISPIFEEVHEGNHGWKFTDFISTSRVRSSHYMNSMPQFMMMVFENLETLMTLGESVNLEAVMSISEPIKWCLLSHLQDKEEFSAEISNLRYYYFSLFTGFKNCKEEASLLITKLPKVIRDPIAFLAIRRLVDIHSSLDGEVLSQATSVLSHKSMKAEIDQDEYVEDAAYDTLPEVKTPFGFSINNTRTFLKAAYMSIYHNKDEAERGPAAKQIVSKLCKQEHHMTTLLESEDGPDCWTTDLGKNLPIYRFNANACLMASDLLKEELLKQRGLTSEDYQGSAGFDEWIENTIILPTILQSTYDQLATTKASFVDNGDIKVSKYRRNNNAIVEETDEEDNPIVGQTVKCLEAILSLRRKGIVSGMSPSDDLKEIITEFKVTGSKLVIKIFKKNQLTGVREIYILTIIGRLLQRLAEDISRSIAKEIHEEKLTGPETKENFVSEHKSAASSKSEGRKSITINSSGDKTQWANYLQGRSVTLPTLRIIPKKYHPLMAHYFNATTKKEIELPASLIESFLKHPTTDLEDDVLNEVKAAVMTGEKSELAKHDSSRITCKGNTMQGIAHYTSTVYHSAALFLLRDLIKRYLKEQGFDSHVSFEVSSDDKGFMATFFLEKDEGYNLVKLVLKITKTMRFFERVIDSAFGIRDSRLKSVTTISVSFEFNSTFYFGNSIATPIAKFTARCCDDTIQSTLHNRVSSMYSSVRQIRDNGGSGILCSLATMCQHIVMKCNLGFKNFSWFDSSACRDYHSFLYSHMGYRRICSPLTAGLCMSDFENSKFARENVQKKHLEFLSRRDLDSEELPEQLSMITPLWRRDKHHAMLRRVGLSKHSLSREEALLLLKMPQDPDETFGKIELMAMSGSLARSFAYCQRSDLLRAGMYLMWHKGFTLNEEKISYHDLVLHLKSIGNEVYKLSDDFERILGIEMSSRFYELRRKRARLMPRQFSALTTYSFVRSDLVTYLRELWFGQSSDQEDYLRREIRESCKWITDTPDEFFESRDPAMLHRLINQTPTIKEKVKLLARGNSQGLSMVECLMRDNTDCDNVMILSSSRVDSTKMSDARRVIRAASSRISIWIDALYCSYNDQQICMVCKDDITSLSEWYSPDYMNFSQRRQDRLICYLLECIKANRPMSSLKFYQLGSSDIMHFILDDNDQRTMYYTNHFGVPVLVEKIGSSVTNIACSNKRVCELISKFEKYSYAHFNNIEIDYDVDIEQFFESNGTLAVGDDTLAVAGLIGMVQDDELTHNSLTVDESYMTPVDARTLKTYIEKQQHFDNDSIDLIIDGNSAVASMIRTALFYVSKDTSSQLFIKSTARKNDDEAPSKVVEESKEITEMYDASYDDFLDKLLDILPLAEQGNDEEDDSEEDADFENFIEFYGEKEAELIPGVDYLETSKKQRMDFPICLRAIDQSMREAMKTSRNRLNGAYYDLYNRIMHECA